MSPGAWRRQGFEVQTEGAVEFIDAEDRHHDAHEFHVCGLGEARSGVVFDIAAGDAALVGDDAMHRIYDDFRQFAVVVVRPLHAVG